MRRSCFVIILVLSQFYIVFAQQAEQNSLLWKISGKNFKSASYIFGTMHVQDESVFLMDELVKKHIDMCDAFAIEVLLDEVNPVAAQQHLVMKNKTLKDLLTIEEYNLVDEYMIEKVGQGLLLFQKMKPFFLATQLLQADMVKDKELAMDLDFLAYARKQGKFVFGIERFEDQIKAVDKISLEEQAKMLVRMVSDTSTGNSNMDNLMAAYIAQDIENLYFLTISDTTMPVIFVDAFVIKRNINMTKTIIKNSRKQSVFYAVGAAHLGGPKGIIALLRKKGYTVEPVFEISLMINE